MDEFEVIPQRGINGIRVFINTLDYRTAHFHPYWELLWLLDAPLVVICNQTQHRIDANGLVLFPPNLTHELRKIEQNCTFLCFQIAADLFGTATNIRTDDIDLTKILPPETNRWLRQTMLETAKVYWSGTPFQELYCTGQCALMLHRMLSLLPFRILSPEEAQTDGHRNARLARLITFVDENYTHKIRLSDFAKQEGCSVSYISRFVKDSMNQTFQDYVNTVRFHSACKLIAQTELPLAAISMEAGFSDYRYFSKTFRQMCSMTPAEFRHKAQHILPQETGVHHSIHSLEHIHSRQESLQLLETLQDPE